MSTEKQLNREEEERLWIISAVPTIPVLIYVIIYQIFAISSSVEDVFKHSLLVLALYLFATVGIYEAAESFKAKRSFSFRIRRFVSRSVFASVFVLSFYGLWSLFTLLFSSVLKTQYILILSLLTLTFLLVALVQNPKSRQLIKKLTQEQD